MFIKRILTQHRRDFSALMECEHCGADHELLTGYDDRYYHDNVIPEIKCHQCGKDSGGVPYRPKETRYPDNYQV